jgi:hypothetical protein
MKINIHPDAYEVFCVQMELPRGKDERVDKYPIFIRKIVMFISTPWQLWKCAHLFFQSLVRGNGLYNAYKHSEIFWKYTEAYLKEREWIT